MLPEEVARHIGELRGVQVFEVEKGAIRKFADAVDDRNPLYWDEEYANKSGYDSIIAPPGFFGWPVKWEKDLTFPPNFEVDQEPEIALKKLGYVHRVDGGTEYEFFLPVKAGDILTVIGRTKDVVEREGKNGKLFFISTERTYINQNGDIVAKAIATLIRRK